MSRTEYLLAELRCAALRARLAACDINAIGVALGAGMISPEVALKWLHECNALFYLQPDAPMKTTEEEAPR